MSVATTVTVVVPTGKTLPEPGVATTLATEQLSVVAGNGKVTTALHWPGSFVVMIFGEAASTGASKSLTVMVKLVLVLLPHASVAVQVTVLVPTGNEEPEARSQLTGTLRSKTVLSMANLSVSA